MKRLILQVNVKIDDHTGLNRFRPIEEIYKLSEQQARRAADRWDVDYHQITDCNYLPDKHPCYQRLKMYEMTDYDEILYLDMDAIVLPHCPNVFDEWSGHKISAVRDYPWDGGHNKPKESYDEIRAIYNKVLGAKDDYRPFCSGVMLVTKEFLIETKDDWRQYINSYDANNGINGGHDQAILNTVVATKLNGKYNELNEDWGPWYRSGKYIEHIGGPRPFKLSDIPRVTRKLKRQDTVFSDLFDLRT